MTDRESNLTDRQHKAIAKINTGDEYVEGDINFVPTKLESEIILGDIGHDSAHKDES